MMDKNDISTCGLRSVKIFFGKLVYKKWLIWKEDYSSYCVPFSFSVPLRLCKIVSIKAHRKGFFEASRCVSGGIGFCAYLFLLAFPNPIFFPSRPNLISQFVISSFSVRHRLAET
jgi:hypothetical protein